MSLYQAKEGLSRTIGGPQHRRPEASSLHVELLLRRPRRLELRDESSVFAVAVAICDFAFAVVRSKKEARVCWLRSLVSPYFTVFEARVLVCVGVLRPSIVPWFCTNYPRSMRSNGFPRFPFLNTQHCAALCCDVLCCAALCCAVLRCAALCGTAFPRVPPYCPNERIEPMSTSASSQRRQQHSNRRAATSQQHRTVVVCVIVCSSHCITSYSCIMH
jgi:hypothetical protein